jgi:hypothetical protein
MKTNILKIAVALSLPLMVACEDEPVQPVADQKADPETQQMVVTKNHLDNLTIGLFANRFRTNIGGREARGPHRLSGLFRSRSEAERVADLWDTCALVAITENPSGTYTVILDFGDGCTDADGKTRRGKVGFRGIETDSSGVFEIAFESFAEFDASTPEADSLTLNGYFKGEWSATSGGEFQYHEAFQAAVELLHDKGFKEGFIAEGDLKGNTQKIVVSKHNFHIANSDGESFSGLVVEPLLYDLTCEGARVYTDGSEVYQLNGKSAAIDYGNGECDNIVLITAEGIIVIVDLDKVNS